MKQNKSKILSLRVTQEEYDTLSILAMLNSTQITMYLRHLFTKFITLDFKKQQLLYNLVTNEMITKNKLN